MKNALAATRATLTWLVVTASMLTAGGLVIAVPADAATKTYTATTATEVRTSPAPTAATFGTLAKGDRIAAAGTSASGWLPITYAAKTGYVPTSAVTQDKTAAPAFVAGPPGRQAAVLTVNLRAGASLDADIVAVVKKSSRLKVTGVVSGTFSQVEHDGKTRWVYSEFLSGITDTTPDVVASYTTIAKLALRETAAATAKNLGTLKKGAKVAGLGTHSGSYSLVMLDGRTGWVITGYLKAVSGTAAAFVLPIRKATRYAIVDAVVVRANPDAASEQVASLTAGQAVRTTGKVSGAFTGVIWDGITRWVATISLSKTKPTAAGASGNVGDLGSDSLNKLEPNGKAAVVAIRAAFPLITTIHGWRSSSSYSTDHPNGRAIDVMIPDYKNNKELGDAVAEWVIANGKTLRVSYLIWRQRSYTLTRGTWKKMDDRGGDTANHMNHVHISFEPS